MASAGYQVWAPDQRSNNVSDKPDGIAAYTLDELAADDIEKARNALIRAKEQVKDIYPKTEDEDILELIGRMEDYAVSIDNYIRNRK